MITPEWLINELGYLQTHKDLQESILRDIVRRLMKTDFNVSDTAAWQTEKLQQAGAVYSDIVAEVAKRTKKSTEDIHKAFADAKVEVFDYGDEVLEKAGHVPEVFKALSPKMIKILNAAFKKTTKEVRNLTMTTATTTQSLFIRSCDLAHMQIVSGAFTYQEAIANAIRMAAKEGTKVIYPSGYSCSLDAAVRRAVLTGVNQTTGKLQEMRAVDMDVDLMEITAHSGARPEHAAWQGKVVSRSGRSGYLTLQDIGYGEVKGFMGANCRHNWHLFFEGVSKSAYSKEQLEAWEKETVTYNDEELPVWQARDRQRAMERNVRSSKQLLVAYDEAAKNVFTDEERLQWKAEFNNESVKLKGYEAKLKDFCEQTGLHRDKFREQVFAVETENGIKGFGKSVSQKSVQAYKKELTKQEDRIIIKEIKACGIKGEINLRPHCENISDYSFDDNHINKERSHKVTRADAEHYVKTAKISVRTWKGRFDKYISESGAAYLDNDEKNIRTAFSRNEYGDEFNAVLEVLKKYGR